MSNNILELRNVRHSYHMGQKTINILKGINFNLPRGEWCCVYGASGSGKTTLLNLVGGLEKAETGKVIICGETPAEMSRSKAALFQAI